VTVDPRLQRFVADTERAHAGRLRTAGELFARRPSTEDWLDACVLGGVTLADVLAGRITDADLAPELVAAFHAQYPHAGTLVAQIQELHGDPDTLRGLVSGLKGKLFELEYVDYLNDGHLPAGHVAELAASPTQEGWDIAVQDAHGELVEHLQLKATADLDLIREAIERYPGLDVVVPSDVFAHAAALDPGLAAHLIDAGIDLGDLTDQVGGGIDLALGGGPDLVPEGAFAFIAARAAWQLVRRRHPAKAVLGEAGRRAVKAGVAGALGGAAAWLAGPWVGVPVSVVTRLALTRAEVTRDYARRADVRLERVRAVAAEVLMHDAGVTPAPPPPAGPRGSARG
jgi:hypothetical protein